MTPRLDRSKPYGEVIPSGGYFQDGHFFNVQGEYLRSEGDAPAMEDRPRKESEAKPAVIDLAAWAKGDVKYPFYSVVKHVKVEYSDAADVDNKRAALVDFLVGKGVVSDAEAVR